MHRVAHLQPVASPRRGSPIALFAALPRGHALDDGGGPLLLITERSAGICDRGR
jgi:hypothetical protein